MTSRSQLPPLFPPFVRFLFAPQNPVIARLGQLSCSAHSSVPVVPVPVVIARIIVVRVIIPVMVWLLSVNQSCTLRMPKSDLHDDSSGEDVYGDNSTRWVEPA